MKKTEVSNEFILAAHENACANWKEKIEKEVPELFKNRLEVGKWYKASMSSMLLYCVDKIDNDNRVLGYGFDNGVWEHCKDASKQYWGTVNSTHIEATEEEVSTALIAEAKKRGFKEGVYINGMFNGNKVMLGTYDNYYPETNTLEFGNGDVFKHGKWATIIEQPKKVTFEEIQKKYGCKIEIVE